LARERIAVESVNFAWEVDGHDGREQGAAAAKLQEILGLIHRPALQREMERRSLSWSEFLARMIALWVGNMVNLHNPP
jgi:hypothetical protein